jgi:branched-chain amino acid transport system substrate-binding protein
VAILGAPVAYEDNTIKLGREAVEGIYAIGFMAAPNLETSPAPVRDWMMRYEAKYKQPATLYAAYAYGYTNVMIEGLKRAGRDLTVDSFIQAMEAMKDYKTLFGLTLSFSPTDHLGAHGAMLFQVQNGRWVQASDELQPPTN